MRVYTENIQENQNRPSPSQGVKEEPYSDDSKYENMRSEAVQMESLQDVVNNSSRIQKFTDYQKMANEHLSEKKANSHFTQGLMASMEPFSGKNLNEKPPMISSSNHPVLQKVDIGSDLTKHDGEIYGIYQNPTGNTDHITKNQCIYVGKANGSDWRTRWAQHRSQDVGALWYGQANEEGAYACLRIQEYKQITRFDVAALEQWWIEHAKKNWNNGLLNAIAALSKAKFNAHKNNHSIFTTYQDYGTWEPGV